MTITIYIDHREIPARQGDNLLGVCLDNGIYVPNLCYIKTRRHPQASCRLCFVEVEGEHRPVTACTIKVAEGMVVRTDTPAVRRLQRSGLKMLLSVHDLKCKQCPANHECELQRLARFLEVGLNSKPLPKAIVKEEMDHSHPFLVHYPNRCVLCGKCVYICRQIQMKPCLTFAKRGFDTVVGYFGVTDPFSIPCPECRACIEICPVGALRLKEGPLPDKNYPD